jgi:predicted membrane protein
MKFNNITKLILLAIISNALMICGCVLISCTIGGLYTSLSALTVLSLILVAIFLYVSGATILGRTVARENLRLSFHGVTNSITFALLTIAAGLLLLGFNTGYLDPVWRGYFFSWYMLLLVAGAVCICRYHFITGLVLAAVGKFFLMEKVVGIFQDDFEYEAFITTYWPLLIIVLGVIILLTVFIRPCRLRTYNYNYSHKSTDDNASSDGKINYKYVFSGMEQVIIDPVFRGGNIEVVFGGLELDLRRTTLPEGQTFLYVNSVFGGVVITVPESWYIEIRSNTIFGGVDDARLKNTEKDRSRRLVIVSRGSFGGIELK